jgi:acetoin utilization deacetylase AcuC-like enzyme
MQLRLVDNQPPIGTIRTNRELKREASDRRVQPEASQRRCEMNASKENARTANRYFKMLEGGYDPRTVSDMTEFIQKFLDACERKLPTEAAYQRDRQRRAKKAG